MKTRILVGAAFTLLPLLSLAQSGDPAATPGIDRRQDMQQKRIEQGVRSGELNKREAARLERHQQHIGRMEDRAKADGVVTRQERARLHHAQDKESRRIHRQKHDEQHAK